MKKALVLLLVAVLTIGMAFAQGGEEASAKGSDYPNKEIRVIIPWTTGGGNDTAARIIAPYLEKELGVPLVIDNQGGGGGLVGTNILYAAPKDGYTIGVFSSPSTPDLSYLQNTTTWQPDDFVYLGAFNEEPQTIIVNGTSKWNTLEELIADAKANPGTINVGATGPIGVSCIVIQMLEEATGCKFNFVQFDGTPECITALYGDHIQVAVRPGDRYVPDHQDGRLRILAVASDKRLPSLPEVRTINEAIGLDCKVFSFRGWWCPAGIPEERLSVLRDAFDKVMQNPELQQKITDAVAEFSYTPGEELGLRMKNSIAMWSEMLPKLKAWAETSN